jgi:toxin ParE1/3/4
MSKFLLSQLAKEDLIRIHQYGVKQFGINKADQYFDAFFAHFELIAKNPHSFESVDFIKPGYRRCVCGVDSIFYRIHDDVVEIMTIVGRQDFNQKL